MERDTKKEVRTMPKRADATMYKPIWNELRLGSSQLGNFDFVCWRDEGVGNKTETEKFVILRKVNAIT